MCPSNSIPSKYGVGRRLPMPLPFRGPNLTCALRRLPGLNEFLGTLSSPKEKAEIKREIIGFCRPGGAWRTLMTGNPPFKRWAIIGRPSGLGFNWCRPYRPLDFRPRIPSPLGWAEELRPVGPKAI